MHAIDALAQRSTTQHLDALVDAACKRHTEAFVQYHALPAFASPARRSYLRKREARRWYLLCCLQDEQRRRED